LKTAGRRLFSRPPAGLITGRTQVLSNSSPLRASLCPGNIAHNAWALAVLGTVLLAIQDLLLLWCVKLSPFLVKEGGTVMPSLAKMAKGKMRRILLITLGLAANASVLAFSALADLTTTDLNSGLTAVGLANTLLGGESLFLT
jgi:hypothetical protein